MERQHRRPSMADVAERAGVSYQTVSRVLNEPHRVRPDTRERVNEAIIELGYARNRAARALKTTRSSLIGVLTDGSSLFGPSETTTAIETAARAAGYAVLLTTVGPGGAADRAVGAELLGAGAEGILVVAAHEGMIDAVRAAASSAPVLAVSAEPPSVPGVQVVGVDQRLGARQVVEHLARTGARHIVHAAGPQNWFDARARRCGFEESLTAMGLDGAVVGPGDWTPRSGYELGTRLARSGLPDAIFAANDMMAIGLINALHERGVRVPQDVSVVGFDNTLGAEFLIPPLTSVAQPFAQLGRLALQRLVGAIEAAAGSDDPGSDKAVGAHAGRGMRADGMGCDNDNGESVTDSLAPRLVVRSSTRPERTH